MSDAGINLKFLFFAVVLGAAGWMVIYAGIDFNDPMLIVSGVAAMIGALVVVGICLRPRTPGVARGSLRSKLKYFWMPGKEKRGPTRGATDEEIAEAEKKLGVRLPRTYVRLLKVQDGGEPRYTLWAPVEKPEHECHLFQIDVFHGTRGLVAVTEDMIKDRTLPKGVVCINGYGEDDWQLCLDYREAPDGAGPAVAAFDEDMKCHRLAGGFGEFMGGLTRRLRQFVYAPQGVLGQAADGLLMDLHEKVLGVRLLEYGDLPGVYAGEHPRWRSVSGGAARLELRVNAVDGRGGGKRVAMFPETWSYRVLYCDVDPAHRAELEQCLGRSEYKWVLVGGPVERLAKAGFYG